MSMCIYQPTETKSEQVLQMFMDDPDWNLLRLTDLALTGSSLEVIKDSVPFREQLCKRTMKCCGVCTRQCKNRCLQDSLHRLYIWRKLVEASPESSIPLGIRLIARQHFESIEALSWAVGEIISAKTNTEVRKYMERLQLCRSANPNKIDYAPQPALDESSGKRIVNSATGCIKFREWPETGLCPFCTPDNVMDRRTTRWHKEV